MEAPGKRYRAEMIDDILAVGLKHDLKQQLEDDGDSAIGTAGTPR